VHRFYTTGIIGLERNTLYKHDKLSFHVCRLCTDTKAKEDRRWTRWSRHPFICQESQQEQWNGVSVSQLRTERRETKIHLLFIPSSAATFSLGVSQQFLLSSARDNSARNWQSADTRFHFGWVSPLVAQITLFTSVPLGKHRFSVSKGERTASYL